MATSTEDPGPRDSLAPQLTPPGAPHPARADEAASTPGATALARGVVHRILDLLFRFRRLLSPDDPCLGAPCEACYRTYGAKIQRSVEANRPVEFAILAFPTKSPTAARPWARCPIWPRSWRSSSSRRCAITSVTTTPPARGS